MSKTHHYERKRVESWEQVDIPHEARHMEVQYPDGPGQDVAVIHYLVPDGV